MGFWVVLFNNFEQRFVRYVKAFEQVIVIPLVDLENFLKLGLIDFGCTEGKFVVLFSSANVTALLNHETVIGLFALQVFVVKQTVGVRSSPCYITNL